MPQCRFPDCSCSLEDVFDTIEHCEAYHRCAVKQINIGKYFEFDISQISNGTFLLCTDEENCYWFCSKTENEADDAVVIRCGIFAVSEKSRSVEYYLSLGAAGLIIADYFESLRSRPPTSIEYDLNIKFEYLEIINSGLFPKTLRLYFDRAPLTETEAIGEVNEYFVEKFTCEICWEYIRSDARFCRHYHFMCNECFCILLERNRLECPQCRIDMKNDDFGNERVELLLKFIDFPKDD